MGLAVLADQISFRKDLGKIKRSLNQTQLKRSPFHEPSPAQVGIMSKDVHKYARCT